MIWLQAPPLLIGVAGGTASGKTTVCRTIAEKMDDERVVIISMDNFYRPLTPDERANVDGALHRATNGIPYPRQRRILPCILHVNVTKSSVLCFPTSEGGRVCCDSSDSQWRGEVERVILADTDMAACYNSSVAL